MNHQECLVCYESKEMEKYRTDSNYCQHSRSICCNCLDILVKAECPYCRENWQTFLGRPPPFLTEYWEAIYMWIAIAEGDLIFLQALIEDFCCDPTKVLPFDSVARMITSATESEDPVIKWLGHPDRVMMKKNLLLANGISFDYELEKFVRTI